MSGVFEALLAQVTPQRLDGLKLILLVGLESCLLTCGQRESHDGELPSSGGADRSPKVGNRLRQLKLRCGPRPVVCLERH